MSAHATIYLHGTPYDVDFDYQPAEPPERGPEARYPGCAAEVYITLVTAGGHDITNLLSDAAFEMLTEKILEQANGPKEYQP